MSISKRRKELIKQNEIPEWYITAGLQLFESKYQSEGETVRGRFTTIAKTLSSYLKGTKYEEKAEAKFFELLWEGWFSASTPLLGNTGTDKGFSVSCSGTAVDNSVHGFYSNLLENALLTKYGFGTSSDFSNIQPMGSLFAYGGKANGVLAVWKEHIQAMSNISQGNKRRGAFSIYLRIEHGDFWDVCEYVMAHPDDANIGWIISDEFMSRLKAGDEDANNRWKRILKVKLSTSKGYLFFVDKVNRLNPPAYVKNNLKVTHSNLCVAPETKILTDKGHLTISELEGKEVNVWNGEEFSNTFVRKTGRNQKLITIVTDSGYELDCTPYHKFYVVENYHGGVVEKRAIDLKPLDKLIKFDLPVIEGVRELEHPYDNGLFSADGCKDNLEQRVYLYHEKRHLKQYLTATYKFWYVQEKQNREYGNTKELEEKFFVPSSDYTISSRLQWLAGVCDGDGVVTRNGNTQSIQLSSVNRGFLKDIQIMLQTLGVVSKITVMSEAGMRELPLNNGTGENGLFSCQATYRLLIAQTGICKLQTLGFKPNRLKLTDHVPNRDALHFIKIESVIDKGRSDDTFCFTEQKRGMGMFNGILTGQCAEITLFDDAEHSFTCVLGSMNLAKYNEWKDTDAVFWATVLLDCVCEDFIQKAKGIKGLEKAVRFTEKSRALGLGQMGLHTYCLENMFAFESLEALLFSTQVSKQIQEQAQAASEDMAKELGEPEWCKGVGVRNSHRTAVAPTKSTALLMGGVTEGINPDPCMVFTQLTPAGEVFRINPVFLALLKKKGKYNDDVLRSITDNKGSLNHLDFLTEHEKEVFKPAFNMNMLSIINMANERAKWLCQGQSLNVFFSTKAPESYISKVFQAAAMSSHIKSVYYSATSDTVGVDTNECIACQ